MPKYINVNQSEIAFNRNYEKLIAGEIDRAKQDLDDLNLIPIFKMAINDLRYANDARFANVSLGQNFAEFIKKEVDGHLITKEQLDGLNNSYKTDDETDNKKDDKIDKNTSIFNGDGELQNWIVKILTAGEGENKLNMQELGLFIKQLFEVTENLVETLPFIKNPNNQTDSKPYSTALSQYDSEYLINLCKTPMLVAIIDNLYSAKTRESIHFKNILLTLIKQEGLYQQKIRQEVIKEKLLKEKDALKLNVDTAPTFVPNNEQSNSQIEQDNQIVVENQNNENNDVSNTNELSNARKFWNFIKRSLFEGLGISTLTLAGAGAGALAGSFIPGLGTAIGAGIGAVAGLMSGLVIVGMGRLYSDGFWNRFVGANLTGLATVSAGTIAGLIVGNIVVPGLGTLPGALLGAGFGTAVDLVLTATANTFKTYSTSSYLSFAIATVGVAAAGAIVGAVLGFAFPVLGIPLGILAGVAVGTSAFALVGIVGMVINNLIPLITSKKGEKSSPSSNSTEYVNNPYRHSSLAAVEGIISSTTEDHSQLPLITKQPAPNSEPVPEQPKSYRAQYNLRNRQFESNTFSSVEQISQLKISQLNVAQVEGNWCYYTNSTYQATERSGCWVLTFPAGSRSLDNAWQALASSIEENAIAGIKASAKSDSGTQQEIHVHVNDFVDAEESLRILHLLVVNNINLPNTPIHFKKSESDEIYFSSEDIPQMYNSYATQGDINELNNDWNEFVERNVKQQVVFAV